MTIIERKWVAGGQGYNGLSIYAHSVDRGVNWIDGSAGAVGFDVKGIAYGNHRWVSCGSLTLSSGFIQTSIDGSNWITNASGTALFPNNQCSSAVYGNGLFVVTSSDPNNVAPSIICTSADGLTWNLVQLAPLSVQDSSTSIFANGMFVVCNGTQVITGTQTGSVWTWTITANNAPVLVRSIGYANELWIIGGNSSVYTGTDLINWTLNTSAQTVMAENKANSVNYGTGTWVIGSNNFSGVYTSPDGGIWTAVAGPAFSAAVLCDEGNSSWVGVGNAITNSSDGSTWTLATTGSTILSYGSCIAVGVIEYSVTYSLNGATGTLPTQAPQVEGEVFDLAESPTVSAGYMFEAWSDGLLLMPAGYKYTMPPNDVTLTAQWYYTITYNLNGGTLMPAPVQPPVPADQEFILPDAPNKAPDTFQGWQLGAQFFPALHHYTMAGAPTAGPLTFTASWVVPPPVPPPTQSIGIVESSFKIFETNFSGLGNIGAYY